MLLAIDAGNTNIVFALFDGEKQVGMWRAVTNAQRTADEYAAFLKTMMPEIGSCVTDAIIGSVVPDANLHLQKLCRVYFKCEPLFVTSKDVGLKVNLDRPEEVGADRLINAVAGAAVYNPPLLIVDFGTATTFDVVDAEGNYCGGAIAPGADLSLQALHAAAAKLPRLAVARPEKVIGTNTIGAIQSGIFWGYVGLVEGLIGRIKKEHGQEMAVIATGGIAPMFKEVVPAIQYLEADLTLRGLRLIYERMSRKK